MSTQSRAMRFLSCFNLLLKNLRQFHICIKRTLLRLKNLPLRSHKNSLEYTTVTQNYTTFVLPFIMSLFDFLTPAMLFNTASVCVCMFACRHTEIFARAGLMWADSETSSTCQWRQAAPKIPPLGSSRLETKQMKAQQIKCLPHNRLL